MSMRPALLKSWPLHGRATKACTEILSLYPWEVPRHAPHLSMDYMHYVVISQTQGF